LTDPSSSISSLLTTNSSASLPEKPMRFSKTLTFAAIVCVFATPLLAQNNITQQRVGDYVYYGGTLNGQPVSGNAHQIGSIVYYNLSIGGVQRTWTQQIIGQQIHTQGSDGSTSTSQRIGNQTYTRSPGGISYTQQKIGNIIYITGSNGCRSTVQIIGNQRYTTGSC
jgi:hypothetical protein